MLNKTIVGNLGNQLFQYAALRGIQRKLYPNEGINLSFASENYKTGEKRVYPNHLADLSLKPYSVSEVIHPSGIQRLLTGAVGCEIQLCWRGETGIAAKRAIQHTVELRRQKLLNRFGVYQMQDGYYPFAVSSAREKHFFGYFESEKYFSHIRDELLAEFTPTHAPLAENVDLYRRIAETESVCISVRRGDFVGTSIDDYANICGADYFAHAMERMRTLCPNAVWFFFSDDIEWVKQAIPFDGTAFYERGTDPGWEKLRLMSSCKHFIISNSSFSWWAQYLSDNPNKIVLAPSQWRRNSARPDIYQANWELIEV